MTLREKQSKHVEMIAQLILWATSNGYELTWGDAFRDHRLHGSVGEKKGYGHAKSCHKLRLAVDLNLFKDGKFLTDGSGHDELHAYWVSLGGAPMINGDANHYSLEWEGMR